MQPRIEQSVNIFDFPADQIGRLNDADLRELVARLCEAERELQGGSRTEVLWGGAQTAPDGGLDVVVQALTSFSPIPVLPRRTTGIQVKRASMGPAEITREMRPNGTIRPAIAELAERSGAYLIVSAGDDCSLDMMRRREIAMRAASADLNAATSLHVAFVDRAMLARWLSVHPSPSLWARDRIGLPTLTGWRPHGRWSSTPAGASDDIITAGGLSVHLGSESYTSIAAALEAVRRQVRTSAKAIRIAGLSGVGKSRFVQALFEETTGGTPLPASAAVYADAADGPEPPANKMLDHLIARKSAAIVVVDNCPPEVHVGLAERLSKVPGEVRLITVEYDVRDDRPRETEVVRIEANGTDIAEALVRRRYRCLSQGDAHRLAELAGGNARLALALAEAAPETASLSTFGDRQLFERLFWQRGRPDEELQRAASTLALVYSFNVEREESADELAFLGSLVDMSRQQLYRAQAALLERGLAQARGRWRAVLPHALANRLAAEALRSTPVDDLARAFARDEAGRLRQSFARRLAYLHSSPAAESIVRLWAEPGGPLHGAEFPSQDLDLLERLCHLSPETTLRILRPYITALPGERFASITAPKIMRILRVLAHSPDRFSDICREMIELALLEREDRRFNDETSLTGLFSLYLSGTRAQTGARIEVVRNCILAPEPRKNCLGAEMLAKALGTQWSGFPLHDSARTDPYGWEPSGEEALDWYKSFLDLSRELSSSENRDARNHARRVLAAKLRGLWSVASLRDILVDIALGLHADGGWIEGWQSLREILGLDAARPQNGEDPIERARLLELVAALKPANLVQEIRAVLVRSPSAYLEAKASGETYEEASERVRQDLERLGVALAGSPDARLELGRALFEGRGQNIRPLGYGLGHATDDLDSTWCWLRDLHLAAPNATTSLGIMTGFLEAVAERDPELSGRLRDECLQTPILRADFPSFIGFSRLNSRDLERMVAALSSVEAHARQFSDFVWREEYGISDAERIALLQVAVEKPDGPHAVLDALRMLRHVEGAPGRIWPGELRSIGAEAFKRLIRSGSCSSLDDHTASELVSSVFLEADIAAGDEVIGAVLEHARSHWGSIDTFHQIAAALAKQFPQSFLSATLDSSSLNESDRTEFLSPNFEENTVLSGIAPEQLVEWCRSNGAERWRVAALAIFPFVGEGEGMRLSKQAEALLAFSPRPQEIIEGLVGKLHPTSRENSLAEVLAGRRAALEPLIGRLDGESHSTLETALREIDGVIARERAREQLESRQREQRFE